MVGRAGWDTVCACVGVGVRACMYTHQLGIVVWCGV